MAIQTLALQAFTLEGISYAAGQVVTFSDDAEALWARSRFLVTDSPTAVAAAIAGGATQRTHNVPAYDSTPSGAQVGGGGTWSRNFRAKLANSRNALVQIGFCTDSLGQAGYVSDIDKMAYPSAFAARLQAQYGDGGSGYQGVAYSEPWLHASTNANLSAVTKWRAAGNLIGVAQNGTGTLTSGSPTVTGATGTYVVGQVISGRGIPANTTVTDVQGAAGNYTLTLSGNASASVSGAALFNWSTQTSSYGGPGFVKIRTLTPNERLTWAVRGSTVEIYTLNGATGVNADWRYRIDGGAWTTVTNDSAGFGVRKTVVSGLTAAPHTVEVEGLSTGTKNFVPLGVNAYNATGVVVHRWCIWGGGASYFGNNGGAEPVPSKHNGGRSFPVDLLVYGIGVNDSVGSATTAAWQALVLEWLTEVRTNPETDVLFLAMHGGNYADTGPNGVRWQTFINYFRDLAEQYNCGVLNINGLGRSSYAYWTALGYWGNGANSGASGSDTIHISDACAQYITDRLIEAVA